MILTFLAIVLKSASIGQHRPIAQVEKILIKPFPREGAASWVNDRYVGPGLERMEVHSTEVQGKDDVYLMRYARWSKDNGRTWSPPEKIADTERTAAGKAVWEGGGPELYDPASRALVRLWLRQIQHGGLYHNFTYWQLSRDQGRTWSNPEQLAYEPKVEFDEKNPHDPRFLAVNQGYFGNRIVRLKDGSLVTVLAHTNATGDPENAKRVWRMGSVLFKGRWDAAKARYEWMPAARVETRPEQSGRGLMEPDVAELADGRLLVVWRQDSTAQTPGCKLFSVSSDGGKTLSAPQPWKYDDGTGFYSPSSIHYFFRHARTKKLYWIGNITPDAPRRNSPRYPLVIAEVDEGKASLKRSTVTTIDNRKPEQGAGLQLSNFSVLENRETGEIELKMALLGEHPGRSVYTGDAYHYRLRLVEDGRSSPARPTPTWRAGLARAVITPTEPVWMSGYAGKRVAAGRLHDLWAKALALEDARGRIGLLITTDLIGFSRSEYLKILSDLKTELGLRPDQVILSFSHTHTGPIQAGSLLDYFPIDESQEMVIREYSDRLRKTIVSLARSAVADLKPAILETTFDTAAFAVNRRENKEADVAAIRARGELKGPVDHDVPLLMVRDAFSGKLRALMFGYACHATTLNGTEWSGDYPGFAQAELEAERPGVQAMFWAGCGADQNPLPRRSVELCKGYGHQLAEAVSRAIMRPATAIEPLLGTVSETIELSFEKVVDDETLRRESKTDGMRGRWASRLIERRKAGDPTASAKSYPYTIVAWRLGKQQFLVALAGEVVVDYALRLKKELGPETWAMAYANDLVAYIPSEGVLAEGGYEGNGVAEYGLPAERWAAGIEEQIVRTVKKLAERLK